MKIPFPAFEPDRSRFLAGALPSVLNVLPLADGWGPMQSIVAILPDVLAAAAPPEEIADGLSDENDVLLSDENGQTLEEAA